MTNGEKIQTICLNPTVKTFFWFVFYSVKECNGSLLEVPITAYSRAIIAKLQEKHLTL